jgi:hypothetical protein
MTRRPRKSVYTHRPTTREERGCRCPFPPGCYGHPCRSKGTIWEIRYLVRDRHAWATASAIAVISEDRRADELARIAAELTVARSHVRGRRPARFCGHSEKITGHGRNGPCVGALKLVAYRLGGTRPPGQPRPPETRAYICDGHLPDAKSRSASVEMDLRVVD